MDRFEGFTEDEIQNITTDKPVLPDGKINSTVGVYKSTPTKSRYHNRLSQKNIARERLLKGNYNTFSADDSILPKEARLHIPKVLVEEEEEILTEKSKDDLIKPNLDISPKSDKSLSKIDSPSELDNMKNESMEDDDGKMFNNISDISESVTKNMLRSVSIPILNSEEADLDTLEHFERRRKFMEEQNRQKKEILKRAIEDRAKKTKEEVKRLNEIECELKKLDLLLSNDVAIIRNQIETASIDYTQAQKRYDRAEKEFLDAKLDLYNIKERKELLTSHLCTIIEQNEMRKAKKLSDLMLQLEIPHKSSLMTSQIKVQYENAERNSDIKINAEEINDCDSIVKLN